MPLSIRRALDDLPVIVEFNSRLAQETEGKTLDRSVLTAGVEALLKDNNKGSYFIAEEFGTVIGQLMITHEWSDWRNGWIWWIQSVYVTREARRRGVFRSLYQHVADVARLDPGIVGLRLYVEQDNHAAQQTYLSLGMNWTSYRVLERYPL